MAQLFNLFQDCSFKFSKPIGPKSINKGKFERLYQFTAEVEFAASLHENGDIQDFQDCYFYFKYFISNILKEFRALIFLVVGCKVLRDLF